MPPPWYEESHPRAELGSGARLLLWLNLAVAGGGLAALAFVVDVGVYTSVLDSGTWTYVAVIGGPVAAIAVFLRAQRREEAAFTARDVLTARLQQVWAAALALLVAGVLLSSLGDAQRFQLHTCWLLRGDDGPGTSRWACAPGREPHEWSSWSREAGTASGRVCGYLWTSPTGATVWRCLTWQDG